MNVQLVLWLLYIRVAADFWIVNAVEQEFQKQIYIPVAALNGF